MTDPRPDDKRLADVTAYVDSWRTFPDDTRTFMSVGDARFLLSLLTAAQQRAEAAESALQELRLQYLATEGQARENLERERDDLTERLTATRRARDELLATADSERKLRLIAEGMWRGAEEECKQLEAKAERLERALQAARKCDPVFNDNGDITPSFSASTEDWLALHNRILEAKAERLERALQAARQERQAAQDHAAQRS